MRQTTRTTARTAMASAWLPSPASPLASVRPGCPPLWLVQSETLPQPIRHMLADGDPAWLVAWRDRDRQSAPSPPAKVYAPKDTLSFPAKEGADWQGMIVPKRWEFDGCLRRERLWTLTPARRVWSGRWAGTAASSVAVHSSQRTCCACGCATASKDAGRTKTDLRNELAREFHFARRAGVKAAAPRGQTSGPAAGRVSFRLTLPAPCTFAGVGRCYEPLERLEIR